MASQQPDLPRDEAIRAVLEILFPGTTIFAVFPIAGSFSNHTHLVKAQSADGTRTRVVIRRYAESGGYDRREKARREYRTFELLQTHGIPAPKPLYLDADGTVLGSPGIVTDYVSGEQVYLPADPMNWARSLATMLARIHSVPCDDPAWDFLLDANAEALWFLRSGAAPDYMQAHPDGAAVWNTVNDLLLDSQRVRPSLVHIDYWPGNILWDGDKITAVIDWEEAAYGDPGIDIAYCRMEMILSGMSEAADQFLSAYEAEMGHRVANLGFWELAAAARPMYAPEGWISDPAVGQNFRRFIAQACKRAGV